MSRSRELSLRRKFIREALKQDRQLFLSVQAKEGETWVPLGLMPAQHPPSRRPTRKGVQKHQNASKNRRTSHKWGGNSFHEWW